MLLGARLALALLVGLAVAGCGEPAVPEHLRVPGGDPERGVAAIGRYGCVGCHVIPGVRAPSGHVGPPLTDYARRGYVAGVVPNWPRYLVSWIIDPPAISPQTAMPALGVTEQDARDIAAYLYTLGAAEAAVYPPGVQQPVAPYGELEALRAEEERVLQGYGRVTDTEVRVPIERAMELLVERAAPATDAPPAQ